jgi:hypothetical protein
MDVQAQQLSVKLFVEDPARLDLDALIPVFHGWIRDQKLGGRLLIDVADYRHVHEGPGVVLIGHEGHYALDLDGGRPGLRFDRKRDPIGDAGPKLEEAFREALAACLHLEQEALLAGLRFRTDLAHVRVLSRLVAPNDDATAAAFDGPLRALLGRLYGPASVSTARLDTDPRAAFGVAVRAAEAPPLVTLLARLG